MLIIDVIVYTTVNKAPQSPLLQWRLDGLLLVAAAQLHLYRITATTGFHASRSLSLTTVICYVDFIAMLISF